MNKKLKKISSVILILFYLSATLGFVLEQKNCFCCFEKEICSVQDMAKKGCCAVKKSVPSCCSSKGTLFSDQSNCNCDKVKCVTTEYLRNIHSSVEVKSDFKIDRIKKFSFVIFQSNNNGNVDFLTEIKSDPPPSLFKDSSFIIEISRIKIPDANLV